MYFPTFQERRTFLSCAAYLCISTICTDIAGKLL